MNTQEKHGGTQGSNLRDPARVIALSDGVFAIVLTILVLDLEVPDLEPRLLAGAHTLRSVDRESRAPPRDQGPKRPSTPSGDI